MTIAHLTSSIVFQSPNALRPHPRNARTHPKRQIKQVADSIKAFGHLVPILIDEAGFVLAGHARLAAAKLIGLPSVPTIVASGLTDSQKRAFMIADNKLTQNAGWDRQMLAVEIGELSIQLPSLDLDIAVTGFDAGEIDVLLSDMRDEKSEPEDILPPDKGIAVTRRGDLWLLGPHRVLCGDAREQSDYARLMNGEIADMVFTDPPYNVPVAGHVQGRGQVRHAEFAFASGEMTEGEFRAITASTLIGVAIDFLGFDPIRLLDHIPIMFVAVIVAVALMIVAADLLAGFVNRNPTIVMLALSFLLMIGMTLIADGFGVHVPKGYIYAAMLFSAGVEILNTIARNRRNQGQNGTG
jgi:ParB-like chromosome segregation protein Spo0J